MATVKLVAAGHRGSSRQDGRTYERRYLVSGLAGPEAELADEALSAAGLPALGDAYSASRPTAVCLELAAETLTGVDAAMAVVARFGDALDESDDPRLDAQGVPRFWSAGQTFRTSKDKDGQVMVVSWSGTLADLFPGGSAAATTAYADKIEVDVDLPLTVFEISRRETDLSAILTRQQTYQGRVNETPWDRTGAVPAGIAVWPARTVKCVSIQAESVNASPEFRVRYQFEYTDLTFDASSFPRPHGVIPQNVTAPTTFRVLPEAEFNSLPCYI